MSDNPTGSFRTHANYIGAFSQLVFENIPFKQVDMYLHLRNRIQSSDALPRKVVTPVEYNQVRHCLHAAWGTEALLRMSERVVTEEELLRLSNNWSSIQAYYVLYHCTQALHVAKGNTRPSSHSSTQNIFYNLWGSRSILLEPWSLCYGFNGHKNSPPEIQVDVKVNSWTNCVGENVWNLACKALMTTRRDTLSKKKRELREEKKRDKRRVWERTEERRIKEGHSQRKRPNFTLPNLTKEEKVTLDSKLRNFTLIDYLYRLRLKTNYEDSIMFTDGPEDDYSSSNVRSSLCQIASGSLFLHELAVMSIVGRTKFINWAQQWIDRNLPRGADGLRKRFSYF